MNLVHKIRSNKKIGNLIKKFTIILLSIFLSIHTIYFFIPGAANVELIIITTIILFLFYCLIVSKLIIIYNKILNWINLRLTKNNLKFLDSTTQIVWFLPALLSAISSFILFCISNVYMKIEVDTLGDKIDYGTIVTNLNFTYFPAILIGFILIGFLLQILVLKRIEKVKIFPVFISSFLTIAIFVFIFFIIRNIISNILIML